MKQIKIGLIMVLPMLFLLNACVNNQRDIVESDELEEIMMIEFNAIDFSELDEFFQDFFTGFDPEHIYNFHYADVTSDWSESRIPAPTVPRIQGFFNIVEEAWGYYVNEDDSWRKNLRRHGSHGASSAPDIFEVDITQLDWVESTNFTDRHRSERISGNFLICKESRLIWFHLWRG